MPDKIALSIYLSSSSIASSLAIPRRSISPFTSLSIRDFIPVIFLVFFCSGLAFFFKSRSSNLTHIFIDPDEICAFFFLSSTSITTASLLSEEIITVSPVFGGFFSFSPITLFSIGSAFSSSSLIDFLYRLLAFSRFSALFFALNSFFISSSSLSRIAERFLASSTIAFAF